MNDCTEFESLIDREHAGEALTAAEQERLAAHLEGCRSCDELFDLLGALRVADAGDEPADAELAVVRSRVRAALRRPAVLPFRHRVRRWLPAAAALGGVALGWSLGSHEPPPADVAAQRAEGDAPLAVPRLTGELRRIATRNASFEQTAESPFLYRNVRVSSTAGGRVRLAFDVARHLDLELKQDDPLLAEVLVQAMVEPDSIGTRLAAIDASSPALESKVRRALVVTMRHDPNLAVRLRAQERLASVAADDEITAAMLEVLADEESVEMRFAAIDYLTGNRIAPEQLEQAIRSGGPAGGQALLVHARDYLYGRPPGSPTKEY